jgi:2,3-bisphosphoglycerate-dependent phosphoglycerate mutase
MEEAQGEKLKRREAARLLILDSAGRVLLFRYTTQLMPSLAEKGIEAFWGSLGGAVEPGETFEEAAARELTEETGLRGVDVGRSVACREFPMEFGESWVWAVEQYFVVRVGEFTPDFSGFTALEREVVVAHRWWSAAEIAASHELIFPDGLDRLLEELNR